MSKQYKAIHPSKYYRDFLAQNVRPDGREFMKFRSIGINVNAITTAEGSAIVKLGNTTVICGVKAELTRPKPEYPDQGFFVPNVELSPLCSSRFRPGPPSEQAQVASQLMLDFITDSNCLDLKQLCVVVDKVVWVLYCDIICTDYDGAVLDACLCAIGAALQTVKLPKIDYFDIADKIEVDQSEWKRLNIGPVPVSTSFVIFDDSQFMVDPTSEEEGLCSGSLSIVVGSEKVISIHKPGGTPLSEEQLNTCTKTAISHSKEICKLISTVLESKRS